MDKPIFEFDKQLEIGNAGERKFLTLYKNLGAVKSTDRRYDFLLADGSTVELKTDTYDMGVTQNFFMEILGSTTEAKIGGPWRAMQDRVTFFVYFFPRNNTFFWFDPSTLCQELEKIIAESRLKPKTIKNKNWETMGYAVPRHLLEHVEKRRDIF